MVGFCGMAIASLRIEQSDLTGDLYLAGRRIPTLCVFRRLTGHRCVSCGMTRGFIYIFGRRPLKAVRANPLSPAAFTLAVRSTARALRRLLRAGVP